MPSKRMWVIKTPSGRIMWDTVHRLRDEAAWLARKHGAPRWDFDKTETAWMKRTGYRAVRVRCEVEEWSRYAE